MLKTLTRDVPVTRSSTLQQLRPIDFYWIARVLWREKMLVAVFPATFLFIALAYCLTATPLYSSAVSILVGPRQPIVLTEQQSAGNDQIEAAYVDSQVEILKSTTVLDRVVKAHNLDADPEFSRPESTLSLAGLISVLWPFDGSANVDSGTQKSTAVNKLRGSLAIKRVGLTYILETAVTTKSPVKSAEIANSVADAFLQDNLDARSLAAEEASQWLQGRANSLRGLAVAAETRVQKFKSDNNIVTAEKGLVTDQEVSEISSQLTTARGQLSESQAKYDRITAVFTDGSSDSENLENLSLADSIANTIIVKLRSNYIENSLRITQLTKANGESHISVQKLKAENAILKQNITNELQRTADSYRNDLEIVKARVLSLESSMRKAVNTSNVAGSAQVHLNDLEREAESYRAIYQMSLSKLQESTQQQSFPVKDFRVITAAMPNAMKSWPKSLLTLSLASIAGLALGVLIALMRAWTDKTLHAPLDVRQQIDEHCLAAIPQLAAKQLRIAGLMNASQLAIAGPLRDIRLALNGTFASDTGVVVGVISTNRQEGRSTVALGLASSYVSAGFKTLVVDADFDNPRISQNFAVADERGFMGALTISDHTTMNALVDEKSGLHVMFAGSPSSEAQRLSALSGNAASKTMDQLRRNYDIIIMDFAPLKESNDALAFSALVDSYIYVIEARATRSSDILLALEDAQPVYSRVKGFVLTKTKKHGFVWPFSKLFASSLPKKLSAIETYIPR